MPEGNIYLWDSTDWEAFAIYLNDVDWSSIFSKCSCANNCWELFSQIIKDGIQQFVPLRSQSVKGRLKHSKAVRKLIAKRKKLWQIKRKNPTSANSEAYNNASLCFKSAITSECADRELNVIKSGNLGQFYKHVNSRLNHRSNIAPLLNKDGVLVTKPIDKAEILNESFVNFGTIDNGIIPMMKDLNIVTSLGIIYFDSTLIMSCIVKLKAQSAAGPDSFPPIIYKQLAHQLCEPLAIMFRLLMQFGEIPDLWKQATVTPIFKKGSSSSPENYRPISLTCVCCKLFEAGIKFYLMQYLTENNFLSPTQHGFLSKHSTCTNLLESLNEWTEGLNMKVDTLVAYVDFAKAFDRVSIPKLLAKLEHIGITGKLLSCIKSFLTNRSQRVRIDGELSGSRAVISGVPQGSVIGPILFLIYINDVANSIPYEANAKLFADDLKTCVRVKNNSDEFVFIDVLEQISNWAEMWQLPLATAKYCWMDISNKRETVQGPLYLTTSN